MVLLPMKATMIIITENNNEILGANAAIRT
jgi:hypothetical protein